MTTYPRGGFYLNLSLKKLDSRDRGEYCYYLLRALGINTCGRSEKEAEVGIQRGWALIQSKWPLKMSIQIVSSKGEGARFFSISASM